MNNDLWIYIQQIHNYLNQQEKRIELLEQQIEEMKQKLTEERTNQTINIEKIEYKFDQLKVETLEGTLTIGLSPKDLENFEEIQVNDHHLSPKKQMERSMEIEEQLFEFIESELPHIIIEQADTHGVTINEEQIDLIKQDLQTQMPNRVAYYFEQLRKNHPTVTNIHSMEKTIVDQTKKDMINGIEIYMQNLKEKE